MAHGPDKIHKNKIGPADKRRAENIEKKLKHQGMGEGEAEKRAMEQALSEENHGRGGGSNGAGQSHRTNERHGDKG